MALATMGTPAATTLAALIFNPQNTPADLASLRNSILDDIINSHPIWPGAAGTSGALYVPNRGILKVLPGDYIAVDTSGWPILISARAAATAASWTHT
jgi:hypothetical protein